MTLRTLPSDQRAERELVGLALNTMGEAYDVASVSVRAESFYDRVCSLCWASIGRSRARSETPSMFTLAHELKGQVDPEEIMSLDAFGLDPFSLPRWMRIVTELAQRRALVIACRTAEAILMGDTEHAEAIRETERLIYADLRTTQPHEAYKSMAETVQEVRVENAYAAAEQGRVIGIQTGIESLDMELGGIRKGELVVIGGRTSEGKSSLALCIARYNAQPARNKRSVYFSCEMTRQDLVRRLVAGEGVTLGAQESYWFATGERTGAQLRDAYNEVERMPIEVVYQPAITFAQVRTYLRRFSVAGPIDMVFLDYLGIMGSDVKASRRDLDVSDFISQCLTIGAEFGCPVIAIQGLNRKVDADGKLSRPRISHLMDAAAIEYGAHKVLLVHNPNATLDGDDASDDGGREILIAKNRRGKKNRPVKTKFIGERFLFADIAPTPPSGSDRGLS
jgi:replicative DNA helicase